MKKILFMISVCLLTGLFLQAQEKGLKNGMLLNRSVKIRKAVYKIEADSAKQAVIIIEGNNIVIDFNNAVLQGNGKKGRPDEFTGVAILIKNGKNITIKNLKAKGYKVALLARNVNGLIIENCDFSYNYRQHLNSTQQKEDISDWLSHHQNEKDEWLRYGAGMYLQNCRAFTIKNCKVTGGQNALMLTECNDGMICNNDFSFNSGLGIGMYRSSRNNIMYNKLDFNVRGYSDGVYSRGQDSAGILVYEQSNNNLFYKNSVTHSGDGFFLWAGQTTMDSGTGGCNDNRIMENDFSYAPTNGVEVTFSRNVITGNRIYECDHGIWGGYSYKSDINSNKFRNNRIAIAIEHGQQNTISYNLFYKDKEAIRLWGKKEEPSDWGYPKYKDTKSRSYIIASNSFNGDSIVFSIAETKDLNIFGNTFSGYASLYKTDSGVAGLDTSYNQELADKISQDSSIEIPSVNNPQDPFKGTGLLAGRKNIRITEWGPYDFRSPLIWNTNPMDTGKLMQFEIVGPKGKWKIKNYQGVTDISANSGDLPAQITAEKSDTTATDIKIQLEYTGEAIVDPFGKSVSAGKPYSFSFSKFFQPINWAVKWFGLDTAVYNPVKTGFLFAPNVKVRPLKSEKTKTIDYAWWGGIKTDQGTLKQFITVAEGQADFKPGTYEIGLTWDDAVKLYVDDKLVIDEWNPSLYTFDESPHRAIRIKLNGNHRFRLEHMELGGFATLSFKLNPVRE
ncbi:MAG: right-handed parallel beta-helix repeat-containing protein [Bacteroidetes bacterium]|nr:right-handed parallel beta-helix repeat-containing protein [Bacteroidota bacterium]